MSALFLIIAVAALAVVGSRRGSDPPGPLPISERPKLLLLTNLALMFGEDFARGRPLPMAQPLARTAENLVALDDWVRRGGHVLLIADPLLE